MHLKDLLCYVEKDREEGDDEENEDDEFFEDDLFEEDGEEDIEFEGNNDDEEDWD